MIGFTLLLLIDIVLGIFLYRLYKRVSRLEEDRQSPAPNPAQQPDVKQAQEATGQSQPSPPAQPQPAAPTEPPWPKKLLAWIKEDWLLKLGGLLLLIGFGWFATYAFLNNWIGPIGRISLGIIAGALILALGWWRIRKYVHQGSVFLVLGSTIILLTIFAAREIYGFFTPASALTVMFLSAAFVAFTSVRFRVESLAFSSIILAAIAPLLTNSPAPNYVSLFMYLFIVSLGTVWVVALRGWRPLNLASLVIMILYSLTYLTNSLRGDSDTLLLIVYAFAALFFVTNTWGMLKLAANNLKADLIMAAGNGLWLLAWIMIAAPDQWQSLIIVAWMLVFVVGAFGVYLAKKQVRPFYIYAAVGVAFLAAATALELDGAALTLAYTVESASITLVTYAVLRNIRMAEKTTILMLGPAALSLSSLSSRKWRFDVIHEDFFVVLILSGILFCLGLFFWYLYKEQNRSSGPVSATLLVVGSLYAYALLWLSLHAALLNDDTAVTIALTIFTLIGLATFFTGRLQNIKNLHIYGGVMLGAVVLRLLAIDMWDMDITGRIITFFLVGALLVSTAFIGRDKKETHETETS